MIHVENKMEHFPEFNAFKTFLYDNLESISSPLFTSVLKPDFCFKHMNGIIIYSSCKLFSVLSAHKHIQNCVKDKYKNQKRKKLETDISGKNGKITIHYSQHANVIEIDIDLFLISSNEKIILIDFIKDILSQRCILDDRYIIHIIGIDKLPIQVIKSLQKVIELYYDSAYFVLSCSLVTSLIQSYLASHVLLVKNIPQNENILYSFFSSEMQSEKKQNLNDLEFKKRISITLRKSNNDIVNAFFMWNLPNIELYKSHLNTFIENNLNDFIDNTYDIIETEKRIRSFCINIGAACIPLSNITFSIIKYAYIKFPSFVYDVVGMSSEMEHISKISNKEFFVFEHYIKKLVYLLKYKKDPHLVFNTNKCVDITHASANQST